MNTLHAFQVGDRVIFTNDFGVCWGVKTVIRLDTLQLSRESYPVYYYTPDDTPWCYTHENNLKLADSEDAGLSWEQLQAKHGFKPTLEQLGGCY